MSSGPFCMTISILAAFMRLVCPMALASGALSTSEKIRLWDFGACSLCILQNCVTSSSVWPMRVTAVLRRPKKKHVLEVGSVRLVYFVVFLHF